MTKPPLRQVAHEGTGACVVPLLDVWHPGLAEAERSALAALFPPWPITAGYGSEVKYILSVYNVMVE